MNVNETSSIKDIILILAQIKELSDEYDTN